MPDTGSGFRIDGDVLVCPYDMNAVPPRDLRTWCDDLLKQPGEAVKVDLSGTKHIASHHLGVLAQAWSEAVAKGKGLAVRISPDMRRVFEMSGLDQVLEIDEG
jgi:anti-anti-sigma factor